VLLAGCDRADDHDVELRASEFAAVEGRRRLPT
jgi:hypothetical protein